MDGNYIHVLRACVGAGTAAQRMIIQLFPVCIGKVCEGVFIWFVRASVSQCTGVNTVVSN